MLARQFFLISGTPSMRDQEQPTPEKLKMTLLTRSNSLEML